MTFDSKDLMKAGSVRYKLQIQACGVMTAKGARFVVAFVFKPCILVVRDSYTASIRPMLRYRLTPFHK